MSKNVVKQDTTVLYYDCTNYYFETEQADPVMVEKDKNGVETKTIGLRQYSSRDYRRTPGNDPQHNPR